MSKPVMSQTEVAAKLKALGIPHFIATEHQIKISSISFYHAKGTILIDGQKKCPVRGFEALIQILQQAGLYKPAQSPRLVANAKPRQIITLEFDERSNAD